MKTKALLPLGLCFVLLLVACAGPAYEEEQLNLPENIPAELSYQEYFAEERLIPDVSQASVRETWADTGSQIFAFQAEDGTYILESGHSGDDSHTHFITDNVTHWFRFDYIYYYVVDSTELYAINLYTLETELLAEFEDRIDTFIGDCDLLYITDSVQSVHRLHRVSKELEPITSVSGRVVPWSNNAIYWHTKTNEFQDDIVFYNITTASKTEPPLELSTTIS